MPRRLAASAGVSTAWLRQAAAKSPAVAAAGLFHFFPSAARSGEQTCRREHDPGDERSDAGKQQDVI
jgi:hypothetical protein